MKIKKLNESSNHIENIDEGIFDKIADTYNAAKADRLNAKADKAYQKGNYAKGSSYRDSANYYDRQATKSLSGSEKSAANSSNKKLELKATLERVQKAQPIKMSIINEFAQMDSISIDYTKKKLLSDSQTKHFSSFIEKCANDLEKKVLEIRKSNKDLSSSERYDNFKPESKEFVRWLPSWRNKMKTMLDKELRDAKAAYDNGIRKVNMYKEDLDINESEDNSYLDEELADFNKEMKRYNINESLERLYGIELDELASEL